MHDRKLNGCRQRLLFARQLTQRKCSLCSQGTLALSPRELVSAFIGYFSIERQRHDYDQDHHYDYDYT